MRTAGPTRSWPSSTGLGTLVIALMIGACAGSRAGDDAIPRYVTPEKPAEIELPESKPLTFEEEIAKADQLRDAGQLPEAVWYYLRSLRLDHESPTPRQRIAYLQLARDVGRAEEIFRQLIAEHPELASAHVGLGLALFAGGKHTEARATLEFALTMDPESAEAITTLGLIEDHTGSHELAREYYERARKLAPMRYEIPNNIGMSYIMSGEFEQAAEAFRAAIFVDPTDPVVHNNFGFALGRMGSYGAALESFERYGTKSDALNNVGYTCYLNGDYSRALEYYERALMSEPRDRDPLLRNLRAAEDALLAEQRE
jgi:Tfp pilus assembly protein PilF